MFIKDNLGFSYLPHVARKVIPIPEFANGTFTFVPVPAKEKSPNTGWGSPLHGDF